MNRDQNSDIWPFGYGRIGAGERVVHLRRQDASNRYQCGLVIAAAHEVLMSAPRGTRVCRNCDAALRNNSPDKDCPEGKTSTAAYWHGKANREKKEAKEAGEFMLTPQWQLEQLERKLAAMRAANVDWDGNYTPVEIAEVVVQIDDLQKEMKAAEGACFAVEWSLAVTQARRAEWNHWVRALKGGVSQQMIAERERKQGWKIEDLKRAVKLHGLT